MGTGESFFSPVGYENAVLRSILEGTASDDRRAFLRGPVKHLARRSPPKGPG